MTVFELARFVLCALCALGGLFVLFSGVLGVFRFKYSLSRIHAAALLDTVGILLMLLSVIIAEGLTVASLKMLAVIGFLWLTSPVSSHLIGKLEVTVNDELEKEMTVEDREMVLREKEGD